MKSVLVFVLVLLGVRTSAEVQELAVRDFRGGLVNSVANSVMQDNQAYVLENFDINKWGELTPRPGLKLVSGDTVKYDIQALIPLFGVQNRKKLLEVRTQKNSQGNDTASQWIDVLTICDQGTGVCTTITYNGLYDLSRTPASYYNVDYSTLSSNVILSQTQSELLIFNDSASYAYPARPLGPGQPKAIAMDGGGSVSGSFSYKYLYLNKDVPIDTSNLSAPSWEVTVRNGKVLITNLWADAEGTADTIWLYRSSNGGPYQRVARFPVSQTFFVDTIATTNAGDTLAYPWGPRRRCESDGATPCSGFQEKLAPGSVYVTSVDTCTTAYFGVGDRDTSSVMVQSGCTYLQWAVVFEDINGHKSYMSPAACTKIGTFPNWKYKASLTLPVPKDSGIVKKYLIRMTAGYPSPNNYWWSNWYKVAELSPGQTTFVDSVDQFVIRAAPYGEYCENFYSETQVALYWGGSTTIYQTVKVDTIRGDLPETDCYDDDSTITFKPSSAVSHGSRVYAVGDFRNPHRIYYSKFGYPTVWPVDKFLVIPSDDGDWPVKLLSYGNDALLIFRQNSIAELSGLSFYQYQVRPVAAGIGLTAPRSLSYSSFGTFFAHTSGIYQYPNLSSPLTIPVDSSFDSMNVVGSIGKIVNGEYWFSDGTKTLIYSQNPAPHWKCYSFGVSDAVPFDVDTTSVDYQGEKWLIVGPNDSLYGWLYDTTSTDAGANVSCKYRSKFFFDNNQREKIAYIDLFGSGVADTFTINIWADSTTIRKTVKVLPNFQDQKGDRVIINEICEQAAIEIITRKRPFTLEGYNIGWIPWDGGKK